MLSSKRHITFLSKKYSKISVVKAQKVQSLAELVIWLTTFFYIFRLFSDQRENQRKMVILTLLDDDEIFEGKRK